MTSIKKAWASAQAQTRKNLSLIPTAKQIWMNEENITRKEIETYESQFGQKKQKFNFKAKPRKKSWHKTPISLSLNDLRKIGIVGEKEKPKMKIFFTQKTLQERNINWNALRHLKRFKNPAKNNFNLTFFYDPIREKDEIKEILILKKENEDKKNFKNQWVEYHVTDYNNWEQNLKPKVKFILKEIPKKMRLVRVERNKLTQVVRVFFKENKIPKEIFLQLQKIAA